MEREYQSAGLTLPIKNFAETPFRLQSVCGCSYYHVLACVAVLRQNILGKSTHF